MGSRILKLVTGLLYLNYKKNTELKNSYKGASSTSGKILPITMCKL